MEWNAPLLLPFYESHLTPTANTVQENMRCRISLFLHIAYILWLEEVFVFSWLVGSGLSYTAPEWRVESNVTTTFVPNGLSSDRKIHYQSYSPVSGIIICNSQQVRKFREYIPPYQE